MSGAPDETSDPEVTATTVVVQHTGPDTPTPEASQAALASITERIAGLDERLSETLEGNETWRTLTTAEVASLKQELADLKATLATVAQTLPAQVTELRAELTRISLAVSEATQSPQVGTSPPPSQTTVIAADELNLPPPPVDPASVEGHPAAGAPVSHPAKRAKRVI